MDNKKEPEVQHTIFENLHNRDIAIPVMENMLESFKGQIDAMAALQILVDMRICNLDTVKAARQSVIDNTEMGKIFRRLEKELTDMNHKFELERKFSKDPHSLTDEELEILKIDRSYVDSLPYLDEDGNPIEKPEEGKREIKEQTKEEKRAALQASIKEINTILGTDIELDEDVDLDADMDELMNERF